MSRSFALLGLMLCLATSLSAQDVLFEKEIRPILKAHCFHCHGEDGVIEGELDLRLRRLIASGGESGPAIEAGNPQSSLLLEKILDGEMPPGDKSLPEASIELIRRWIEQGAKTARAEPDSINETDLFTDEERNFWAFQPIRRPVVPEVGEPGQEPIDAFVLAKLKAVGLDFSQPASRQQLARRIYFDLIGMPPSPEELKRFVNNPSPLAVEQLIDSLLASPHYGERWGRHWLDVAGYADSEGYTEDDRVRESAFRYRDYVIKGFNDDKPWDAFIREQLAGDEMVQQPLTDLSVSDIERLTATGFLRMAPDGTASGGIDQNLARNQTIADTIEIVSTSLLGMTVACARCHNHRYDPITQVDYYRMRAVFEPAMDWKQWKNPLARRVSLYTQDQRKRKSELEREIAKINEAKKKRTDDFIALTLEEELAELAPELRDTLRTAYNTAAADRSPEQKQLLADHPSVANISPGSLYLYDNKRVARAKKQQQEGDKKSAPVLKSVDELKKFSDEITAIQKKIPVEHFVRALTEPPGHSPTSQVFSRGDHEQPRQEVTPGDLSVLGTWSGELDSDDSSLPTSGRRLAYAKQLTNGDHPLVARVIVNRVWAQHFGHGIVNSLGDFGMLGDRPSHPELLDWLASEFIDSGWSLKWLHRLILSSRAYQQSSRRSEGLDRIDPDNQLLGRQSIRRLQAEVYRDSVLAVSGQIDRSFFGKPIPVREDDVGQIVLGEEKLDGERKPVQGDDLGASLGRRSIYVQVRRSRPLGVLETFDTPAMTPNCTQRNDSNVAPQPLMLMNSDFAVTYARHLARRIRHEVGDNTVDQIRRVWNLTQAVDPNAEERDSAERYLAEQTETLENPDDALASLCHALLSTNRFLYVD